MSLGESNLVRPDAGLKILYRGTLNSFGKVSNAGLTQDNRATDQALANTTLSAYTPHGILAGSVVAVTGAGEIGKATNASVGIVGIAVNDAVGAAYESASGAASGKVVYMHGSTSLIAVSRFETHNEDGSAAISYAPGVPVYASANGLLTVAAGLPGGVAGSATVVGIIVEQPTTTNPLLVVQLRV